MNEGVATFKVDVLRISKFTVGDPGEPYCKIPIKHLKLLNKFLGMTISNSKTEFCKEDIVRSISIIIPIFDWPNF